MTLGVVTITYNAAAYIQPFLRCCLSQAPGDFELLIIDNRSSDDSVQKIEEVADSRIKVVRNHENIGFAAACNQAIHYFKSRGIKNLLFINNDTEFDSKLFHGLSMALTETHAGVITPRIVYFEDPTRNWYSGGRIVFWKGFQGEHIGEGSPHDPHDQSPRRTETAPGCCMLIPMSVFDSVGVFDEACFVYFEDVDFFIRLAQKNIPLVCDPRLVIRHKISLSTGGPSSEFSIEHYHKNQIYLLRKHYSCITVGAQFLVIILKIIIRLVRGRDSSNQAKHRLRVVVRAILEEKSALGRMTPS
jgi:GT2 family glycosyltransferase